MKKDTNTVWKREVDEWRVEWRVSHRRCLQSNVAYRLLGGGELHSLIQQRKSKECVNEREGKKERESEKQGKCTSLPIAVIHMCVLLCKRMKRLREGISNGYVRKDIKWCETPLVRNQPKQKQKKQIEYMR